MRAVPINLYKFPRTVQRDAPGRTVLYKSTSY
jgi:hypothetical protein